MGLEARERRLQTRSLEYLDQEARARTLKVFEESIVPALFQTEAYASAHITSSGEPPEAVQARLERQDLLHRPDPPLILAIMSENALDWPVRGDVDMAEQLGHLLEVADYPNMGLRVVPRSARAYQGLDGSFTVLSTLDVHIGYTEAPGAEKFTFLLGALPYMDRFDRIGLKALSDYESKELIRAVPR